MRQTLSGNQILTFCPKIKKSSSNPNVFYPPNRAFTLKRADLSLDRSEIFLNTFHHQQICISKQHIQLVEIFVNAFVSHFSETKGIFDDLKCVFNPCLSAYLKAIQLKVE